jgi:hypothetical protein
LRDRKENSFPVFTHNITSTTNTAISTIKGKEKEEEKWQRNKKTLQQQPQQSLQ